MGGFQNDDLELGFDPGATRDKLIAWLCDNDADVRAGVPAELLGISLSKEEREAALWERAKTAAMIHTSQPRPPNDGSKCDKAPCKVRGISNALLELWHEWEDRHRSGISESIDAIAAHLCGLNYDILLKLERAASAIIDRSTETRNSASAHAWEMVEGGDFERAAKLYEALAETDRRLAPARELLAKAKSLAMAYIEVEKLSVELRGSDLVRGNMHRPLPSERGPGPRRASLLAGLLTHMQDGGVSYREIDDLVVGLRGGDASTTPAAVKDRIRSRIGNGDRRRIRPHKA